MSWIAYVNADGTVDQVYPAGKPGAWYPRLAVGMTLVPVTTAAPHVDDKPWRIVGTAVQGDAAAAQKRRDRADDAIIAAARAEILEEQAITRAIEKATMVGDADLVARLEIRKSK